MKSQVLCIIPARSASKRLPNKNILPIGGKPLIAHSIEQALRSKRIQKVVVSTNDAEIAKVSETFGAEVIFRPEELSGDHAPSESALLHALEAVERSGFHPDLVVFLQGTSPIRAEQDIDNAIETFYREKADSLLSVTKNHHFLWHRMEGSWKSINYDFRHRVRGQDFPEQVRENGSIYLFKPEILKKGNNRLGGKIATYEMGTWSSFEVDTVEELELCQWILAKGKGRKSFPSSPRKPKLIISDFDGVMTDNRVLVGEDGRESVSCNRSDGWAIQALKGQGIQIMILSSERNPVVRARCDKLGIPFMQGSQNKWEALQKISLEIDVPISEILYIGNDLNDLECIRNAGIGVAVADAHEEVGRHADFVLHSKGGEGAIQELYNLLSHS